MPSRHAKKNTINRQNRSSLFSIQFWLVTLLVVILANKPVQAQLDFFNWGHEFASTGDDEVKSIVLDEDGNSFLLLHFKDSIEINTSIPQTFDAGSSQHMLVVKLNEESNPLWVVSVSASSVVGGSLVLDTAGNIYVVGSYSGTSLNVVGTSAVSLGASTNRDVFTCKIDPTGEPVWIESATGTGDQNGTGITTDDTHIYICGYFRNTIDFGGGNTETSTNAEDGFFAKYDIDGNLIWTQSITGSSGQYCADIEENGGHIYLCGTAFTNITFKGTPDIAETCSFLGDYWIAKFDKVTEEVIWANSEGGFGFDSGTSLTIGSSSVAIAGNHSGMTVDGNSITNVGASDIFVSEYDFNGTLQTIWSEGGSGWETPPYIVIDSDNELFLAGGFSGNISFGGVDSFTASGSSDSFIAKYDASRNYVGVTVASSGGADQVNDISFNSNQRIVVGGLFKNTDFTFDTDGGQDTLTLDSATDAFVLLHNDCGLPAIINLVGSANDTICLGDLPSFIDGLPASGGDGSYAYEWQQSPDLGTSWEPAFGSNNSEDYSPPSLGMTYSYRRQVVSGCSNKDYSPVYQVSVLPGWPAWDQTGNICTGQDPIVLDSLLSDDIIGSAQSVVSEIGVTTAFKILGTQDAQYAQFYHANDEVTVDMQDTIPMGWACHIVWKKKSSASGTAEVSVYESIDDITYNLNSTTPQTSIENFVISSFITEQPTRYLRFVRENSQFDFDAITFSREATHGGTWTGPGIVGNTFDPSTAGVGAHSITYTAGNSPCTADSTRTINVIPGPTTGTASISEIMVCSGNSIDLLLSGYSGTIQWQSSTDNIIWTDIPGATSPSHSEFPPSSRSYRAAVSSGSCGPFYSNEVSVSVQASGDPSFSYGNSLYCSDASDPVPVITGDSGGTFSEPSTNIVITNSSTGEIDLSLSTPGGPYTITYTLPGGCGSDTYEVSIEDREDPSFSYPASVFCSSGSNPVATISGTPGGSFSCSNSNVVFADTSTGEIDLSASTAGGPYSITYTTSGGCPDSSTFDITIVDEDIANAGVDQTTLSCGTTSTTLLASTPSSGTGTWSIQSGIGGSITSLNDPNSSFSGNAGETYVLRWTISNLPCSDNYDEVTISFPSVAVIANAGPDQTGATMCNLTSTTLAANNPFPGTGTWSIISGTEGSFADPTDPTTTFTGITEQTYVLEWTIDQAPCPSSSDTVTIDFPHNPSGAYAGTDKVGNGMCGVTSVTMNASSPAFGSGSWSVISGVGGSFDNTSSNTAVFSGNSGETYTLRWTVSNAPCGSTMDEITVDFLPVPTTADAGSDQTGATLCGSTSTTLDGNAPSSGTGTWTVLSGIGGTFTDVNDPNTTFTGTAGETYELQWTISTGFCSDSSDTVNIEFAQNPSTANAGTDITDDTLCGLTEVVLDGNTPTIGIGTWTIESGAGGTIADSNDPNTLFSGTPGGMYTLRWTISNPPCADSFDEVTIYFPENPTVADAGVDQVDNTMCGVTSVSLAANTALTGIGTWSIISGVGGSFDDINDPNALFTGVAEETYVLRWTISNPPCADSFDEVSISFYGMPTPANAGLDQNDGSLCGLTNTSLSANVPVYGTGTWSIVSGSGGIISDVNNSNSVFNGVAGENYVLQWTVSTAMCGSSEDEVEIWFGQQPTTASAGPNQNGTSMCGTTSTILEGNAPLIGSGVWTVQSGTGGSFDDPTDPTTTFHGTGGNSYVLRWTISNAPCADSFDETIVTFYQGPSPADAGSDQVGADMCGLSSTILNANAPGVGTATWSVISGTGGSFSDIHDPAATFTGTPGESYTLRWTIGQIPCGVSYDEVDITFYQDPSPADAGLDKGGLSMCGLDQTALEAVAPAIGTGAWAIIDGMSGSLSDFTDPNSTLFGSNGETYTLVWTVSNGPCAVNSDTLLVEFTETPEPANAGPDMLNGSLCGETDLVLSANDAGNAVGTWTILSGTGGSFADTNDPNTTFFGLVDETYQLLWTIDNGVCPATNDTVDIHFDRPPTEAWVGPDQDGDAMCGITMAGIAANTPAFGTGVWTIESGTGGNISNPNNPSTLFTGVTGESYTLRWTISLAPCAASYDELVVTFHPLPGPVNAGSDQDGSALCGLTSTSLNAQTPTVGTGLWTVISGTGGSFADATDPQTTFFGSSGTSYELLWTVSSPPCADATDAVNITFPALPTSSNAGEDQNGSELCGLDATQLEANMPTIGTGSWSIDSGIGGSFEDASNPQTQFYGVNGNTYVLRWSISNSPCAVDEDLVTVYFPALPSDANGGDDQTGFQMCGLTSIEMEGEAPTIGTGSWSVAEGENGSFTDISDPQSIFDGDAGGEYTLVWTTANEACTVSTDTVIVVFENLPVAANAGPDQQICLNESATLFGNDPGVDEALWLSSSTDVELSSPNQQETTFNASSPGQYELVWSIGNGLCAVSADTMIVEVLPIPMIEAGVDSSICGNTVQLYGYSDDLSTGQWITENEDLNFEDINNIETIVAELVEGANILVWQATDGTCAASDTVTITSHIPWEADAGINLSVCGIEAQLQAVPQHGTGEWSSNSADNFWPNANDPEAIATANIYGSFTFTWTETDGVCTSSDEINVTFWQEVEDADAGEDQILTDEYTSSVVANDPAVGYGYWTSPNNDILFTDSLAFDTEVANLPYGNTVLTWTIANGACESSSDDLVITVNQSELPTGFSPNNDGSNDFFEIRGLEQMSDTRLTVFDRWGNMVYDMENYDNSWDGSSIDGVLLPDDTYFYTFKKDGTETSSYVVIRR